MNIAVVDTEATGLPSQPWARVIEIGAVALSERGHELGFFSSFVHPDPFDPVQAARALDYTGISAEDVLSARSEAEVRDHFVRWCENYSVEAVWSFNRVYDEEMLRRSGFSLPWAGCIMRAARRRMPPRPKDPSLLDCVEHFRLTRRESHRALADAQMAADVIRACWNIQRPSRVPDNDEVQVAASSRAWSP